ncbi:hypothetical protein [Vreelandella venusta]|uniref:hypothetical protein n=1 Tax=Vreelandella venusta TaxID=44935 RepID=UPI0014956C3E|nr:hypothetical protein [Halomonas venusta]
MSFPSGTTPVTPEWGYRESSESPSFPNGTKTVILEWGYRESTLTFATKARVLEVIPKCVYREYKTEPARYANNRHDCK